MEQMRRELENTQRRSASPSWAQEFEPGIPMDRNMETVFSRPTNGGFSAADFAKFQSNQRSNIRATSPQTYTQPQSPINSYRPSMGNMYGSGFGSYGLGMQRTYNPMQPQQESQTEGKGKARMVELDDKDWEAQFASLDQVDQNAQDQEANEAMETELNDIDRSVEDSAETNFGDFESIWRGIQAEQEAHRQMMEEDPFGEHMHMGDDMDQWQNFDGLNTHGNFDPRLGDYMFEDENLFNDISNPFEEGQRIMAEGGNLSLAALAFEAAVQKDPQHVAAWVALGHAQAQNEKETPAIRALEQALKLDPDNLDALMGSAVSYTNEGYDSTAYRTLERWVATKYPSVITEPLTTEGDGIGFTDRHQLQQKVTDLFIRAAQLSPSGEQMDPDVQVGLGVLFYGSEEYDKAVDCFGAALASTETGSMNRSDEIHLLWNRLGATLANSGRSEEAIDAYGHALELRPNFVRARYNLGVSCINMNCYEEAAQHLLGALAMHKVAEQEGRQKAREVVGGGNVDEAKLERMIQQNQSTNLYDTLRRIFAQMERRDLQDKVGAGMDLDSFRREFDF